MAASPLLQQLFGEAARAGLLDVAQLGFKDDGLPSGVPVEGMMHGPNGLFSTPGLERPIISTHVHGTSLASRLPARMTDILWPEFAYITGFTEGSGEEADGPCDDPPLAGYVKNCIQTAHFGLVGRQTTELDIKRVGELTNRGEMTDLFIVNDPLLDAMRNLGPTVPGVGNTPNFRMELAIRMMALGIEFQRKLGKLVYTGDPANATSGGYDEFPGLDLLIATGHIDSRTQDTCPSLDSVISDFEYGKVDDNGGNDLITRLTGIIRYIMTLADDTGMSPLNLALVMRRDLFYEITAVWPCTYLTHRCAFVDTDGQQRVNVDAKDAIDMRDSMRRGMFLWMDGDRIPVITDSFIDEETWVDTGSIDTGCYASDIYGVPLSAQGGRFVSTYWEVFNYDSPYAAGEVARQLGMNPGHVRTSDGGRFLWITPPSINGCVVTKAWTRPRLILRTPHFAFRLQNVQYCPERHTRDAHPDDSFHVDGGVTGRSVSEPAAHWNT